MIQLVLSAKLNAVMKTWMTVFTEGAVSQGEIVVTPITALIVT